MTIKKIRQFFYLTREEKFQRGYDFASRTYESISWLENKVKEAIRSGTHDAFDEGITSYIKEIKRK